MVLLKNMPDGEAAPDKPELLPQSRHLLALAPLSGCTDRAFRELCRENGADYAYVPMIGARALLNRSSRRHTLELCDWDEREKALSVQLFGADPVEMADAARALQDLGAPALDINMGCRMPKVVHGGAGAALTRSASEAFRLVEAVREATTLPLSVKTRLNWGPFTDIRESFAWKLASQAGELGLSFICLHARTALQVFTGSPDYARLQAVCRRSTVPVLANGDLTAGRQARELLETPNCLGLALGRGALSDPALCARIRTWSSSPASGPRPLPPAPSALLRRHLELTRQYARHRFRPDPHEVTLIRSLRHLWCYSPPFRECSLQGRERLSRLFKAECFSDLENLLATLS